MKIASTTVTDAKTGRTHCNTLIQTELGAYFILSEDLDSGEIASHRITPEEAGEFRTTANNGPDHSG